MLKHSAAVWRGTENFGRKNACFSLRCGRALCLPAKILGREKIHANMLAMKRAILLGAATMFLATMSYAQEAPSLSTESVYMQKGITKGLAVNGLTTKSAFLARGVTSATSLCGFSTKSVLLDKGKTTSISPSGLTTESVFLNKGTSKRAGVVR